MTALPSNLALVADDLALATMRDARREQRRRRLVTYSVAFALLALTGTAAVANGWLFGDETPVIRVIPSLARPSAPGSATPENNESAAQSVTKHEAQHRADQPAGNGSAPLGQPIVATSRTLISGLGLQKRVLSSMATTTGGVCLTLTGFDPECFATFAPDQDAVWFFRSTPERAVVVWGVVRGNVTAVEVVSTGGTTTNAEIGNGGFYAELTDGSPDRLLLHLDDGSSETVEPLPCPLTTPDCTP
jgi:hypothetical protein